MKRLNKLIAATTIAAGLVAAGAAQAHGIWFAERATQLAFLYGIGADDLDSAKRLPQVTSFTGYDAAGKQVATKLTKEGHLVLVDMENQPALVAAVLENGTWCKTPEGKWLKETKDKVPACTVSEKTTKYAVHVHKPLTKPLGPIAGQVLQIVPTSPKMPALIGDPITIQVLYMGKPVAGANVLMDMVNDPDQKPLVTGADGKVTFPIRNQGLNVLAAIFRSPSAEPTKYNDQEHLATLSFVLPHLPE